jgi:hypothetical protein
MWRRIPDDTRYFHLTGYANTGILLVTGDRHEAVTRTVREGQGRGEERMGPMFDQELMRLRMREIEERVGHPRKPAPRRRRWRRRS